ncbi:hypothetical protein [Citrobacter portucalensis]|uniref:hypothetical protein n=1 Tax=Citrobacter portucalensis TaxID=1639133 RepID=UPI002433C241|nr:hypothetical protein [Citrobacter portucalensis]WFZ31362.1 hypothetical protein NFK62_11320 [Citrobacter portucalensis]WFZ36363.1 hypothetical protein NFK63_11310 [Citrobacter portucalensis]
MKKTDSERLKHEITGLAVLEILRKHTDVSLAAVIKQLRLMQASEIDGTRKQLIDSVINDFTNINPGKISRKPDKIRDESAFSASKKPKLH